MSPSLPKRRSFKAPPPGETGHEALYLRSLCDRQVNVQVQLLDGETVRGWIEYFDEGMLRLTREGKPNLFIYKNQIRTITEVGKLAPRRAKAATAAANGLVKNGEAS
jgi:host factor-I protein